jgi:hypothetical protein
LASLQTQLTADAHLAEVQFLHEEQTPNKAKPLMYQAGTQSSAVSKTHGKNLANSVTAIIMFMIMMMMITCINIIINSNMNAY